MKKLNKNQSERLEKWVEKAKEKYQDWEYDVKGCGCEKAFLSNYLGKDLNKALDEIPVKYSEKIEGASMITLGVHGLDLDENEDIIDNETIGEIDFQYPE